MDDWISLQTLINLLAAAAFGSSVTLAGNGEASPPPVAGSKRSGASAWATSRVPGLRLRRHGLLSRVPKGPGFGLAPTFSCLQWGNKKENKGTHFSGPSWLWFSINLTRKGYLPRNGAPTSVLTSGTVGLRNLCPLSQKRNLILGHPRFKNVRRRCPCGPINRPLPPRKRKNN